MGGLYAHAAVASRRAGLLEGVCGEWVGAGNEYEYKYYSFVIFMNMNISSFNIHVFMNIIHIYINFPLPKRRVKSTFKIVKSRFVLYIFPLL
jgi:hypothetical protein